MSLLGALEWMLEGMCIAGLEHGKHFYLIRGV